MVMKEFRIATSLNMAHGKTLKSNEMENDGHEAKCRALTLDAVTSVDCS
jgi:hypothetical protein